MPLTRNAGSGAWLVFMSVFPFPVRLRLPLGRRLPGRWRRSAACAPCRSTGRPSSLDEGVGELHRVLPHDVADRGVVGGGLLDRSARSSSICTRTSPLLIDPKYMK